ncbi:aspartic peptidase domain-containing protein [Nemania sp. FL0916]|nr:aspartic peptidase domain-containing protein [Nemania sp. FL0916]
MSKRFSLIAIVGALFLAPSLVHADTDTPSALWLEPSLKWYGIDGNWSSTTLFVGEPAQEVDVVVSTSISEVWVVETSGCGSPLCNDARGGVFNRTASKSWSPMGLWQLGLKAIGIYANGDYAMETVVVYDSVRRWQTSFNKLLVAGINDTAAFTGFFGLGITEGNFGGVVAKGPVESLVQQSGLIPSHSYGYTPGAYYAGAKGTPMSLTLGGYDANRFEPHDVQFSLNGTTRQPQVLVRAITASVSDVEKAPTEWSAASIPLSSFNESVTATIDSSTPYLWLPPAMCDRFASALNLTWNDTFGLYLISNDNLERYKSAPNLSFTFTLSSLDNRNNFGSPTNMSGVVNITVSSNAFVQILQYPFMNLIDYGAPAIPYFPLKRAENGSQPIIGRSFLQEAYIITNYETSLFSLHKARFPANPLRDTSIQTIAASPDSPYPGPPRKEEQTHTITQNQIAGVVVGVCLGAIAAITTVVLIRRRRNPYKDHENEHEPEEYKEKYLKTATDPGSPTSPIATNLFRKKTRAKNCRSAKGKEEDRIETHEVGADWSHERYEMPASLPVELDATNTTRSAYFAVPAGDDIHGSTSYKRPQQWAQPSQPGEHEHISEPVNTGNRLGHHLPPPINTHYRDSPSPTSSPTQDHETYGVPSPITPPSDGSTYLGEYPSPMAGFFPARTLSRSTISNPTVAYTPPSPTGLNDAAAPIRSPSSVASIRSQATAPIPSQPAIQRTPIDSSHVVCLGPLPDNVRLPRQLMVQRPTGAQSHDAVLPTMPTIASEAPSRRQSIADTLGSNFTLEEEARVVVTRDNTTAFGRIDGFDIVHVPQMAHQRYSWEEER